MERSEPNQNSNSVFENISHHSELMVLFRRVILIDAQKRLSKLVEDCLALDHKA